MKFFLSQLEAQLWGPWTLVLLLGTGCFLTVRLNFLQFGQLPYALKLVFRPSSSKSEQAPGDISNFAALMTALSASIGTGSIVGVATAVVLGGPGSIFWMWITALLGMATKYAEAVLAVKYRVIDSQGHVCGGPMYYIQNGLGKKWLAILFAIFTVIASFGIGSTVQANSIALALEQSFHINATLTGILLTILTAVIVLGGIHSIAKVTTVLIPFMVIVYFIGGLIIVLTHITFVWPAIKLIFTDAFTGAAFAGGMIGKVIQSGVSRGLFSNEAGLGSSPIVAAAAKTDHSVRQALIAMTGTFFTTLVMCTITGFVLVLGLVSHNFPMNLNGAALTNAVFQSFLPFAGAELATLALILAAYSTIIGWFYYGEKTIHYLVGNRGVKLYAVLYTVSVMLGSVLTLETVWSLANIFNVLMAIPNLLALLILSGQVRAETQDFYRKKLRGELL
ncbi:MAG: sodium:alanine symporter family protein [Neisseriaceae bacterium]